jgi:guanylate kinase
MPLLLQINTQVQSAAKNRKGNKQEGPQIHLVKIFALVPSKQSLVERLQRLSRHHPKKMKLNKNFRRAKNRTKKNNRRI